MPLVVNTSSATADPLLDGTTWMWTWSATPAAIVADPIICFLDPETLRIPVVARDILGVPVYARDRLGIPVFKRDVLRC